MIEPCPIGVWAHSLTGEGIEMTDMVYKTEQERFWASDFGSDYINRNKGDALLASNLDFFCRALAKMGKVESCIEFGANIGMNLKAMNILFPGIDASGVEINGTAAQILGEVIPKENVFHKSILEFDSDRTWDLAIIKGVLIHLNPDVLPDVYDKLCQATSGYLLVAEYYNPSPVMIDYRGHSERLFKRDFAGEILDRHPEMQLVDYGFAYHRDPKFPQDDITWFLLKKC